MLHAPHFTYAASAHTPYNEVSVADRVVKACAWTDGSADFVHADGTVLSFCDEMNTFVAISSQRTSSSSNLRASTLHSDSDGDLCFTSLTLSQYETKVKEALHIYNYYSPHPRVIVGLTATPCDIWRQHSPIDSLIISRDPNLFERNGPHATLWCALRRISLTLHGGRVTFSVRWPSLAVERNGTRSIFVPPVDAEGCVTGTVASLRAFRFAWMEQTFPVMHAPAEWAAMLDAALFLDRAETHSATDASAETLHCTTPSRAKDRQPSRFSKLRRGDAHALLSASQMQSATCNRALRGASARVAWRYDADPTGRVPHAVYWALGTGAALAMVREDESAVLAEPCGRGYTLHHWRRDGTHAQYHQSPNGEIGLPRVIPSTPARAPKESAPGEGTDGVVDSQVLSANSSSAYFGGALEHAPLASLCRGRYLPDVGASCIHISQLSLASQRAVMQNSLRASLASESADSEAKYVDSVDRTRLRVVSSDPAIVHAAEEGSVVYLTSAIEGVGQFAALTNGTVRCHFDDRTILFLIPGADDTEENLVATIIYRDATQCSIRLVKCLPHHPMYRYVAYALPFRRFARLSPDGRGAVVEDTASLQLELLADTERRHMGLVDQEMQEMLGRTQEILAGNEEIERVNRLLLHNTNGEENSVQL